MFQRTGVLVGALAWVAELRGREHQRQAGPRLEGRTAESRRAAAWGKPGNGEHAVDRQATGQTRQETKINGVGGMLRRGGGVETGHVKHETMALTSERGDAPARDTPRLPSTQYSVPSTQYPVSSCPVERGRPMTDMLNVSLGGEAGT
ncbi:MAG: hypothetical protein R6U98_01920, partial [Pirellulaceae bacterium]